MNEQFLTALAQKHWWHSSSAFVRAEIGQLDNSCAGFVEYLSNFPDTMAGLRVLRLQRLARGNYYLFCPIFEVQGANGRVFTLEFVSWKTGRSIGAKGVVFLEHSGRFTHFALLKTCQFTIGEQMLTCINACCELGEGLASDIARELNVYMGITPLAVKIFELGELTPDQQLTNSWALLFAAVAEINDLSSLPQHDSEVEFKGKWQLFSMTKLPMIVMKNPDAFFLGIVARLWARGSL